MQPLWKTVWSFLRKLKTKLPYDPAIPLLGIYPDKTLIQKNTCYVPSSTIHTNQDMETDGWIKMWFIYDAMGILLNHKKEQQKIKQNKIVPFAATQMDLEIIILSKSEKDQYHMISHMWNLKYDTNELIEKHSQTQRTDL